MTAAAGPIENGPKRRTFWDDNELGIFFHRRGDYDLAISALRRAVGAAVFPIGVLYVNLGAAYLGNRMYREAQSCLAEGLRVDPDNLSGHVLLGRALLAMGETGAARTEFERARELDPDSPEGRAAEEELHDLYGVLLT